MIFSSFEFVIFFITYLILHFFIKLNLRIYLIILGSLLFYGYWNPFFIFLPIYLSLIAWILGSYIQKEQRKIYRKIKLSISIIIILIPLLYYKYIEFIFIDILSFNQIETIFHTSQLPIGISFITFTVIAYIIEVYKRKYLHETSFKTIFAYVVFFPQLIAGPILRPKQLIDQIKKPKPFSNGFFYLGFILFSLGLIKKIFFADQIAKIIDPTWNFPATASMFDTVIAVYGFSVQIYMDFSGYIDMAIGLGLILGVTLPINFNKPYSATSLIEFWRCWHITLSKWLKDFIYIPLGGNKCGYLAQSRNILITMLIGGIWHGAGWNFLIWGFLHGFILCISHLYLKSTFKFYIPNFIKIFLTFNIVTLLWIFFRSDTLSDSIIIINKFINGILFFINPNNLQSNSVILFLIIFPLMLHKYDNHKIIKKNILKISPYILIPIMLIFCIIGLILNFSDSPAFIYFDF